MKLCKIENQMTKCMKKQAKENRHCQKRWSLSAWDFFLQTFNFTFLIFVKKYYVRWIHLIILLERKKVAKKWK